jgi:hypothetical protein
LLWGAPGGGARGSNVAPRREVHARAAAVLQSCNCSARVCAEPLKLRTNCQARLCCNHIRSSSWQPQHLVGACQAGTCARADTVTVHRSPSGSTQQDLCAPRRCSHKGHTPSELLANTSISALVQPVTRPSKTTVCQNHRKLAHRRAKHGALTSSAHGAPKLVPFSICSLRAAMTSSLACPTMAGPQEPT